MLSIVFALLLVFFSPLLIVIGINRGLRRDHIPLLRGWIGIAVLLGIAWMIAKVL
jgi:hypothetical protein